jgi:hypothetical protein
VLKPARRKLGTNHAMDPAVGKAALLALIGLTLPAAAADLHPPQLDRKFGEGCWVRFFEDADLKRPLGRLAGALYINSLSGPLLIGQMNEEEFFRRARGAVVGPEARLIAYAERGFRDELFTLEPGREVKDLRALGFAEKVASLKILCDYQ